MTNETTNSETRRFSGAVHGDANADIGTNDAGDRVVRIDLTYDRAPHTVTSTTILSLDAAITLRNHLDGVIAATGTDDDDDHGLYGADAYDLQQFAEAYASLGDAVGAQVWNLLAGNDEVNPNAIKLIRDRLEGMNCELDDALESFDADQQN